MNIESLLYVLILRDYFEKYYKISVSKIDKTTLLINIEINNIVVFLMIYLKIVLLVQKNNILDSYMHIKRKREAWIME